jgi:hypothetical protein
MIKIPKDAAVTRNGEAFLAAWCLSPSLVVSSASGQLTIAMGDALVAQMTTAAEQWRSFDVFLSWADVTGYAPHVRAAIADMVRERPVVGGIHVLASAPIVSMGLTALRLSTNVQVECYSDEMAFLGTLRRARNVTASGLRGAT